MKPAFIKEFCADHEWSDNGWPDDASCNPDNNKICDKAADCKDPMLEPAGYTTFKAFMGSLICLGSAFGAFLLAPPVAKIGRRQCMWVGALIAFVSIVPQCGLVKNHNIFLLTRFLTGCGVGMITFALPIFISEVAPTEIRGTLGVTYQLVLMVGLLFATLVIAFDSVGYSLAFGLPLFPAVVLLLGIFSLPASPRELLVHALKPGLSDTERNKLLAQAKDSMERLRATPEEAAAEFEKLQQDLVSEAKPAPWSKLWMDKSVRRRVVVANMLQWFQQFSGMNCLLVYGAEIFHGVGVPIPGLWAGVICNTCNFLGTGMMMFLIDRWGRRTLFHITTSCMSFFMILCGVLAYGQTLFLGWMLLLAAMMTNFGFALGWGGGAWVYPTEIFPMDVKERAISTSVFSQYFGNFVVVFVSGWISKIVGYSGTFFFFGICNAVGFVLCHIMVKETKGKTLEEVGALFGAEKALLPDEEYATTPEKNTA